MDRTDGVYPLAWLIRGNAPPPKETSHDLGDKWVGARDGTERAKNRLCRRTDCGGKCRGLRGGVQASLNIGVGGDGT